MRLRLFSLCLAVGCTTAQIDGSAPKTPGALVVGSDSLSPYQWNSGITTRERMIITDAATWSKVWGDIVASHSPTPALPAADFGRETIVVASMGQRSSGGYSISIDSAGVAGDTVILAVTERSPGPTCGTTAALTAPVAFARVLLPRAVVRFEEKKVVSDCG